MLLFLLSFGAVEVLLLKKKILIIENSSVIGGRVNGKLLLNSHQKELSLITIFQIQEILKEALNLVNLLNGHRTMYF